MYNSGPCLVKSLMWTPCTAQGIEGDMLTVGKVREPLQPNTTCRKFDDTRGHTSSSSFRERERGRESAKGDIGGCRDGKA